MRGAENSWPCCAAASAVSMDKNILLNQAAGGGSSRGESSPRVARPVVESEIVESAYQQEGERAAETPLQVSRGGFGNAGALVLVFVSSRSRRAGSSSRQLRQDCNDGSRRSCTKSAGVPVVGGRGRRGHGVG